MTNSISDIVTAWTSTNAEKYLLVSLPDADGDPLRPYQSYLRLWLCEMFLAHSRAWFRAWYPVVHAAVRLSFGERDGVRFTHVASPPHEYLARGVHMNYPLTELLPFNGGVVEVETALLALQGSDFLKTSIAILQAFSRLVTVPLEQVLMVAEKVGDGLRDLFGATNGNIHLGFHQAYGSDGGGGGNVLRPGYVAVILATPQQLACDRLSVQADRLHYSPRRGAQPALLVGYDYMLLRIEARQQRDNWRLRPIEEPLHLAIDAIVRGDGSQAETYGKAALAAALQSPNLSMYDRRRVAHAVREELAHISQMVPDTATLGARGGSSPGSASPRSLDDVMAERALPLAQAPLLDNAGVLTTEE